LALAAGDKAFISGQAADTVFGGLSRLSQMVRVIRMLNFSSTDLSLIRYSTP
jgi:hypothetical protein